MIERKGEFQPIHSATRLSIAELQQRALEQFGSELVKGRYTSADVRKFVEVRASGIKVNGVDVISLGMHHGEPQIHPLIESFIEAPQTKLVVASYFKPDIKGSERLRTRVVEAFDRKEQTDDTYGARLRYAEMLAEACATANKPVAVADIANKNAYMLARKSFRLLPAAAGAAASLNERTPRWVPPLLVAHALVWQRGIIYLKANGKGLFNNQKTTQSERFMLDFEQARRLNLARGVQALTSQMQEGGQIVIVAPGAHTMRMEDILLHPKPAANRLRSGVYKTYGGLFGLDYSARVWTHDTGTGSEGWKMRQRVKL